MAKILLAGATGFVGKAIRTELEKRGHEVIRGVRAPARPTDIKIDFSQVRSPQDVPLLPKMDLLINAVGIIQETPDQKFETIHATGPVALFSACHAQGIRRFIQISALGVEHASTRYWSTKLKADRTLQAMTDSEWLILRPSLIAGLEGQSSMTFLKMAVIPALVLPALGKTALQPISIRDLADVVANWVENPDPHQEVVELVGPEIFTFSELLQGYRYYLGFSSRALYLQMPRFFSVLIAKAGRFLKGLSFDEETYKMLLAGSTSDPTKTTRLLGHAPQAIFQTFDSKLASYLRAWATQSVMTSLFRVGIFLVFVITGVISLWVYPKEESVALLSAFGLSNPVALAGLYFFAIVDLILGVVSLLVHRPWLWLSEILLILAYTGAIAWRHPGFLIHPFGPILKNIALLLILLFLWLDSDRRLMNE